MKGWLVKWGDAHMNALDESDVVDVIHRPWVYHSFGILVKSDQVGITLAMDFGEDGKYRTRTFIPRSMVIEEREISLSIPKTRKNGKRNKAQEALQSGSGNGETVSGRD